VELSSSDQRKSIHLLYKLRISRILHSPTLSFTCELLTLNSFSWFHNHPSTAEFSAQVKVKVTLRLTVSQSVSLGIEHLPGAHDQIFIVPRLLQSCFFWAPSLTRGWVCLLYMSLVLASAMFLGSSFLWTRTVSHLRLPFSSPHTTHRVMVEVFDPASTRGSL
jgi:hypothetical protein